MYIPLVKTIRQQLKDAKIILEGDKNEIKSFCVKDGHGIKLLMESGIKVAIITGRKSNVVTRRARELGIKDVRYHILNSEVAYIGDDMTDISLFKRVGLSFAVADASFDAKSSAILITQNRGGHGAVREICEFILKANGEWQKIMMRLNGEGEK